VLNTQYTSYDEDVGRSESEETTDTTTMTEGSHYETLGVDRGASTKQIKKEFLRLSKEVHPDVGGRTANAERFKAISVAASILTNHRKRAEYDRGLLHDSGPYGTDLHRRGGGASSGAHAEFRRRQHRHHRPSSPGLQVFVSNIMRPRTFVIGAVSVFAVAYASSFGTKKEVVKEGNDLVQAWKNPSTGNWETPAPWDPTFQRLNPVLVSVPREQVSHRRR